MVRLLTVAARGLVSEYFSYSSCYCRGVMLEEMIVTKDEERAALRNQLRLLGSARAVPGVLEVTETFISGPHLTHPSVSSSSAVGGSVSVCQCVDDILCTLKV